MSQSLQQVDPKNDRELADALRLKTKYLNRLQMALSKSDDLRVYKLLNTARYYHVIKHKRFTDDYDYQALIQDLLPQLSHYLSRRLIKYLKRTYPFFYYYEDKLGHYQIYFGDWWGHKLFGSLDVINVKFNFDSTEFNKLRRVFSRHHANVGSQNIKVINDQNRQLTHLIKTQTKRDNQESELKSDLKTNKAQARMPWNSARINDMYSKITAKLKKLSQFDERASNAKARIHDNQQKIIELSKESTVIDYEKRCVKKYFGDLNQFNENNKQLYYNYISNLVAGGQN